MTVKVIIACIVISLVISVAVTLRKKKGAFARRRTISVTANNQTPSGLSHGQFVNYGSRPGVGGAHSDQQTDMSTGYAAPQHPAYPQNGCYPNLGGTNLLSYTPSAPPYSPNVYPPPPEYSPQDDDPVYPAGLRGMYPGGGIHVENALSPPPPYEEIPMEDNKPIANGSAPSHAQLPIPDSKQSTDDNHQQQSNEHERY